MGFRQVPSGLPSSMDGFARDVRKTIAKLTGGVKRPTPFSNPVNAAVQRTNTGLKEAALIQKVMASPPEEGDV